MAFAQDMGEYLKTSELFWSRALIRSFVKEIEIPPGKATIHYSTPVPEDSLAGGAEATENVLNGGIYQYRTLSGRTEQNQEPRPIPKSLRRGTWEWYESAWPRLQPPQSPARSCG